MYNVYVIKNKISTKHYVGSTSDLTRRLLEHNRGQTRSTRYEKGDWELVYSEEYQTEQEARRREKLIKSYKGEETFKKLIAGVVYR